MAEPVSPEEIKLCTISSEVPEARSLHKNAFSDAQEQDIPTPYGSVRVAVQGNEKKPAIFTFHDIGLNHITCFQGFFHSTDMKVLLEHFCVYHINAPGQEDGSVPLLQGQINKQKDSYQYPSLDQLAEMVHCVATFFHRKSVIGLGVGAGANVLARFALKCPKIVEGLVLVNPDAGQCGWVEWGYQKFNTWYLKSGNLTYFTEDYLLWHWFGRATKERNTDLVHVYKEYVKSINPVNLALFIDSYSARTDLKITRPPPGLTKHDVNTLKCNTMIVTGDRGPHVEEAENMNCRLDPSITTVVRLADCGGMVLEEAPGRLTESFHLFLQGLGHIPFLSQAKLVEARKKHAAIPTDALSSLEGHDLSPTVC